MIAGRFCRSYSVTNRQATTGVTWPLDRHSEMSVAYQHGFRETVRGKNSIPHGFPPAGLGGGNADIHLEQDSLGVAYAYKF